LEDGALEETQGLASEPEKIEEKWEPIPTTSTRIGPGLGVIGGAGFQAALQKRKEKEAAAEAQANPNGVASSSSTTNNVEENVEETVSILPPRMKEVMTRIDQVPHEFPPENTHINSNNSNNDYAPTDNIVHTESNSESVTIGENNTNSAEDNSNDWS